MLQKDFIANRKAGSLKSLGRPFDFSSKAGSSSGGTSSLTTPLLPVAPMITGRIAALVAPWHRKSSPASRECHLCCECSWTTCFAFCRSRHCDKWLGYIVSMRWLEPMLEILALSLLPRLEILVVLLEPKEVYLPNKLDLRLGQALPFDFEPKVV